MGLFDSFRKIFAPTATDERSSLSRKVQEFPQDPQARQKLGMFLLRQGEIVEGTDQLARAAILYEKGGFTTKAIAVLRHMLKNDPFNTEFQRWLIRLLSSQGHTADAVNELQKVAAGGIRYGTDEQKVEFYRKVAENLPDNPFPFLLVADVFLAQRKIFEAVNEIEKAAPLAARAGMEKEFTARMNVVTSLSGDTPELLEPCGFLWISAGKSEEGLEYLERAAGYARSSGETSRAEEAELVLAAVKEGRAADIAGTRSFEDALRKLSEPPSPSPAEPPENSPTELSEDAKILQSVVEKLKAKVKEEIGDSDPEARYNLGIAYKEMGLLEEAEEEFRLCRSKPSFFVGASFLLSDTLAERGDLDAAIETVEEVLASETANDSERTDFRYQKALFLSRNGKEEEARDIFLSLFEAFPDYRDLRERVRKFSG